MPETLGQYRVGISFNPSRHELVDAIKYKTAELIDLCMTIELADAPHEKGDLAEIAARTYEEAAMWAVKAATKPGRRP